jgi:heme/copper-type cytochrome/quinol oxidase subunit 3
MSSALATIEELGELPAPAPARPRVLLIATVLASAATVVGFGAVIGIYLTERAAAIADDGVWFPDGVNVALTTANMSLVGFVLSLVFMHWAVAAIGNDDRRHAWMAFACVFVVGMFHFVGTAFLFNQSGFAVNTPEGAVFYTATGAQLAITGAALVFVALMAFRTLGGQYSARDREGVVAATVFWWVAALTYAAVWYAIYVTK